MNPSPSLSHVRLSLSSYCELRCSYCDQTGSKKSSGSPKDIPLSQKRIYACNSFYSESLPQELEKSEEALIELHFLTLSLERNKASLERLAALPGEWDVLIDHWDTEKIQNLKMWDDRIHEYRIIPSERYSSKFFLEQLPPFILKKMKWQFLRKTFSAPALPSLNDVFQEHHTLPSAPLHDFAVIDPQWDHTWSDQEAPFTSTGTWSAIDAAKYQNSDWPLKLLSAPTRYVGYISQPKANDYDLKSPVVYFQTSTHSAFRWAFGLTEKSFYLLENFLVRKEIWSMYLRSTDSYNHWTWTEFIKSQNIQVTDLSVSAPTQITPDKLREDLKDRCLKTADSEFYSRHIFNIHTGRFFRQQSYIVFFIFLAAIRYWPKYLSFSRSQLTGKIFSAVQNLAHVFRAIYNHVPQWFWDGPWQWFWLQGPWKWFHFIKSHCMRWFWNGPWKWFHAVKAVCTKWFWNGPWKWFHAVKAVCTKWFWSGPWLWFQAFKAFYRRLYWNAHHLFMSSIGFLISLFDFPQEIRQQSRPRRWMLQAQFMARKWGWLLLKIARRR